MTSSLGWHNDRFGNGTNTAWVVIINTPSCADIGNNVISRYEGNTDGTAYQTSFNLSFNYAQDPTQQPATPNNIEAAIVNTIHDISYL